MSSLESSCGVVSRVVLVGLSGAAYDVLVPLAASGVMPNMHRLLNSAALVRLRWEGPHAAAVAWNTLETAAGPDVHGLLDDCRLDHQRRRIVPARALPDCKTLRSVVTAAEPEAPAVHLDDVSLAQRARSKQQPGPAPIWNRKPADYEQLCRGIARTKEAIGGAVAAAQRVDQSTDWRLLDVRFRTLDSLLQRLWNLLGIGAGPGGNRHWIAKTREVFRTLDEGLEELLELAARRHAALVLVSPYGFGPFRGKITAAELFRRQKLLHAAQGGSAIRYQLSRLAGKLQRRLLRRSAGLSLGSVLPIDWHRTRAVALHGEAAAMIYLNTHDRFGTQVLVNRREYDETAAEVLATLHEARHPVTGELLFAQAYLTAARFGCDPLAQGWPDIVAVPADGFQTRHRFDRNRQLVRHDAALAAVRNGEGLLMIHAPGVTLGQPYEAELVDVAPTVLSLLGLPPAPRMTGRAVPGLFEFRRAAEESTLLAPREAISSRGA